MPRGPADAGAGRDADPAWLPDDPGSTPDWMSAEDWEAWCDATAMLDDEPPPGSGWDDDEQNEPDPESGERVVWSAGFAKGGLADGLRHAVAQAVMDVAPGKAKKRREDAAKDARVERWAEDSGNAALMGRELPPDEVLAADQRITAWARELRKGGLVGDMDVLRARAYLDLLLGQGIPGPSPAAGPPRAMWRRAGSRSGAR